MILPGIAGFTGSFNSELILPYRLKQMFPHYPVVILFQFGYGGDTRRFSAEQQTMGTRAPGLAIDIRNNGKTCEIWEMRIHRYDENISK